MQLLGILIELRGEGAANAGIYRHTWRSGASSIYKAHEVQLLSRPYKSNIHAYSCLLLTNSHCLNSSCSCVLSAQLSIGSLLC